MAVQNIGYTGNTKKLCFLVSPEPLTYTAVKTKQAIIVLIVIAVISISFWMW